MVKIIGYTPRYYLREASIADAKFWFDLNSDPDVAKYTGDAPFKSEEEARTFLQTYDHYEKYNCGRWAIIAKESDQCVGWCGLKYHEDGDYTDLGYRLPKTQWGKGIATETSHLSMMYGFRRLGLETIIGHSNIDNIASVKVLEKMGMTGSRTFQDCGGTAIELEVDKYTYCLYTPDDDQYKLIDD